MFLSFRLAGSDRDDCYHDEDAESIDEDTIDEIRTIYDEVLEKKLPTYPYENYPDLSLGEFIVAEFEQYLKLKESTLDTEELDERQKVIDWLGKQHPYLKSIACNQLTDVSVQGKTPSILEKQRERKRATHPCFFPSFEVILSSDSACVLFLIDTHVVSP